MKRRPRLSDIRRLEALSDGVFAIVLTLLVLELIPEAAQSPGELLDQWPTYIAYLAAFLSIGSIWLNHSQAFSRIRRADPMVLVLNLALLLGASLVPWPTALISKALQDGSHEDQVAAMIAYSIVALLLALPWSVLDHHLARRPELLNSPQDAAWMRTHSRYSDSSVALAPITVALAFLSPIAALVLYLVVVAVFVVARVFEREDAPVAPDEASPQ